MLKYYGIIREVAHVIEEAAMGAVAALNDQRVEQEPAFTDRMLGRIEHALEGYEIKGVSWKAKTLTDRGRNAQESKYGADFLGVASIELPNFKLSKGFLAQAKLLGPTGKITKSEYERMQGQCKKMLGLTPDSFVFLYSIVGISIVPAISVVSCNSPINPHDLYSRSMARFYEEHFACFIGDGALSAPRIENLEEIASEYRVRNALGLYAKYEKFED